MRSEMPKKYWKNLPETGRHSRPAGGRRVARRGDARGAGHDGRPPTPPPSRTASRDHAHAPTEIASLDDARAAAAQCTRCDLYMHATQTVFGEGPDDAALMIVGEQPGDQEDLAGRPFVGPAGQLLDRMHGGGRDRALARPGSPMPSSTSSSRRAASGACIKNPDAGEVQACQWWLGLERRFVQPRLIVGMGATAALALTGPSRLSLTERRGKVEEIATGPVLLTWHPSFILRVPDEGRKAEARAQLAEDLTTARELLVA